MSALSKVELYFSITQGDDNTIFIDFLDENDSEVNLSSKFSDIIFTLYDKGGTQELQWTLGSGISIQNTNRLNITFSESDSEGLNASEDYDYTIQFVLSSNSKKLTGIKGGIFVEGPTESSSNSVTAKGIVFNEDGQTFQLKTNYLAEHLVDVVEDIESERDSAINNIDSKETTVLSNIDQKKSDAVDVINNYIDDSENYALSITQFTDQEGNTVEKGAKGFKQDTETLRDETQTLRDEASNFTALEQVNDLGSISDSTQIDLSNGTVVQATLTGSVTLSFTGLPDSGTEVSFTLAFSGAETITYPSGTEFAGGSAPSIIGPDYELPCSIDSAGNLTVYGVIDEIA